MTGKSHPLRGFTLIELMITLAIAAVLMMVAVPSFISFQRNSELTTAANTILGAMNTARTEAMKRNRNAIMAPTGTGWSSGWQVFIDTDRNGAFTAGELVVATYPAIPAYFSITGTGNASGTTPYVLFNGSGYASDVNGALGNLNIDIARNDLSGTELLAQTRRIKVANTGRVRVCKATGTVNCTASGI